MTIKTVCNLPPLIRSRFDRMLLSYPAIIGDNLDVIWECFLYIEIKRLKKIRNHPSKLKEYELLKQEFLNLYEWTKAKEEKLKEKTPTKVEIPFYFIYLSDSGLEEVWRRLRSKRVFLSDSERHDYEISQGKT